jgi:hypothetical protein
VQRCVKNMQMMFAQVLLAPKPSEQGGTHD